MKQKRYSVLMQRRAAAHGGEAQQSATMSDTLVFEAYHRAPQGSKDSLASFCKPIHSFESLAKQKQ